MRVGRVRAFCTAPVWQCDDARRTKMAANDHRKSIRPWSRDSRLIDRDADCLILLRSGSNIVIAIVHVRVSTRALTQYDDRTGSGSRSASTFGVSRTFHSRFIGQQLSDASRDLATCHLTLQAMALVSGTGLRTPSVYKVSSS